MAVVNVKPEALDFYCRGCGAVRIHVLSEDTPRYFCGTCNRSVTVTEVMMTYSWDKVGKDPEIIIIMVPPPPEENVPDILSLEELDA